MNIVKILEEDRSRKAVSEIIDVLKKHQLLVGESRDILEAASCVLNLAPADISCPLPTRSDLLERIGARDYHTNLTRTLLRVEG